jgi:hypothetical protein
LLVLVATPPAAIDGDASFVIYIDADEIKSALKTFGFQKRGVSPATGVETWPTLKEALNRWHTSKGGYTALRSCVVYQIA